MNAHVARRAAGLGSLRVGGSLTGLLLVVIVALGSTLAIGGCEKPSEKAENLVMSGKLIGISVEEANKIVGKPAVQHDEFNYYWDFGPGNGVVQVLVRGGKISRVDREDAFVARAARDNTTPPPFTPPSLRDDPSDGETPAGETTGGGP